MVATLKHIVYFLLKRYFTKELIIALLERWASHRDNKLTSTRVSQIKEWMQVDEKEYKRAKILAERVVDVFDGDD